MMSNLQILVHHNQIGKSGLWPKKDAYTNITVGECRIRLYSEIREGLRNPGHEWLGAKIWKHEQIHRYHSKSNKYLPYFCNRRRNGEQSTALATATDATLQELYEWNVHYRQKFGFVFLVCASGRSNPEIITEIKLMQLLLPPKTSYADVVTKARVPGPNLLEHEGIQSAISLCSCGNFPVNSFSPTILCVIFKWSDDLCLTAEDCMNVIGGHLTTAKEPPEAEPSRAFTRTRPPITTHILDVARDTPASGVDVHLEMWADKQSRPLFGEVDSGCWKLEGRSSTDRDGRSGQFDEHGGRSKAWDISD
ncbi:hypothetical protein SASPL_157540 [Salvia splendens]|uniref:2-oxo-4-hydroxy-4-carboxy-5-ureidoimidazoline decarboxylase n=1 Tax=Salvia splendens TaxID=180675 RepID=A0A8X8YU34_SALSN|nr:hypothetical protein SASPL_157540 [Salvia splendens]